MQRKLTFLTLGVVVTGVLVGCSGWRFMEQGGGGGMRAANMVARWPAVPKQVANQMIAKYGNPDEATPSLLIWHGNGPWKHSILSREEVPHRFPKAHTDVLEQAVNYRVPADKFDELAAYDGSVIVERTKGELSARCDKEDMNYLALNLAHDIVTNKRTVDDARRFYAQTVAASMKGEKSPYTQRLLFPVQRDTADPDQPMLMMGFLRF